MNISTHGTSSASSLLRSCRTTSRQENYTRLLWLSEGFTSYYDDLVLARAGLFTEPQYLKSLAKTLTTVTAAIRKAQAKRGRKLVRRLDQVLPAG